MLGKHVGLRSSSRWQAFPDGDAGRSAALSRRSRVERRSSPQARRGKDASFSTSPVAPTCRACRRPTRDRNCVSEPESHQLSLNVGRQGSVRSPVGYVNRNKPCLYIEAAVCGVAIALRLRDGVPLRRGHAPRAFTYSGVHLSVSTWLQGRTGDAGRGLPVRRAGAPLVTSVFGAEDGRGDPAAGPVSPEVDAQLK
jgi:hypothetical protein